MIHLLKYTKVDDHIFTNLVPLPRMLDALFYPMTAFSKNIHFCFSHENLTHELPEVINKYCYMYDIKYCELNIIVRLF